jgi:hypothetical protein
MATRFNTTLRLPADVMNVIRTLSLRDGRPQWILLTEALGMYKKAYTEPREPHPGLPKGRPVTKKVTETFTTEIV